MSNNKNFLLDMAILINFIVLIFTADSWLWIHVGAGITLLICLIFHIAQHWWWFKTLCRTGKEKSKKDLRNRILNIALLIVSALTILSGALTYAKIGSLTAGSPLAHPSESWLRLHQPGAMLMLALAVWHFAVHWNWLVSVARGFFKEEPCQTQK